ncbi:MAG TPA: MFS transporter, partial [Calditrichia bacterium]|nr:MFS transporter [Calditrichia bacterium]
FLFLSALFSATFYYLQPQDVNLILGLNLLVSFCFGPVSVLQWAIYTDTADYSEWKNNRRATGLIMSASLFALKVGLALGGTIVGWILGYYGFVANAVQSDSAVEGIRMLLSVYPAVFGIIGAAFMIFYPLNNDKMVEIEKDLNSRRDSQPAVVS